jgi:hypothetical protein
VLVGEITCKNPFHNSILLRRVVCTFSVAEGLVESVSNVHSASAACLHRKHRTPNLACFADMHGYMIQGLKIQPGDHVLDLGSGCGATTAMMAFLVRL